MAPTNTDPKILMKCYERNDDDEDNSIMQQHTDKNVNTGSESSYKNVYRRRMSRAN